MSTLKSPRYVYRYCTKHDVQFVSSLDSCPECRLQLAATATGQLIAAASSLEATLKRRFGRMPSGGKPSHTALLKLPDYMLTQARRLGRLAKACRNSARYAAWVMLTSFSQAAFAAILPPMPPEPVPLVLQFDYPTNGMDTNLWFVLKGTNDISVPLTNWPVARSWPATNWYSSNGWTAPISGTNYTLTVTQSVFVRAQYFYLTASNLWGESNPSNVLALPAPPVSTSDLKARRGW